MEMNESMSVQIVAKSVLAMYIHLYNSIYDLYKCSCYAMLCYAMIRIIELTDRIEIYDKNCKSNQRGSCS